MITVSSKGSFKQTDLYLKKALKADFFARLERFGPMGVAALAAATPSDSGLAASSWGYEVKKTGKTWEMVWTNDDIEGGFPVAIMIQYGHGTGTGGYVRGIDYINPAIKPIFEQMKESVIQEVGRL